MFWKTNNFDTDSWDGCMIVVVVDDETPGELGEEFIITAVLPSNVRGEADRAA